MKAIVCTKYGPPEVLDLREVDTPKPKPDEVRVKIIYTSVTASDCLIRKMELSFFLKLFVQLAFGFGKPRNPIMGMVCSGVIDKTGSNVTKFKPGDAIIAYGAKSPMKRRFGSYAEYICYPEEWFIAKKPENVSFAAAAALPYGGLLADFYCEKAGIKSGQKVLLYGASGSIGTLALQLIKYAGAEVTAVCSARNFEMVESLGADKTIDYTKKDAVSQLEKYDVVLDAVGESKSSDLKAASKEALKPGGKYQSIDDGMASPSMASFLKLIDLAGKGELKAVIDKTYPLEEMVEAHRYVDTGHKKGNVLISVAPEPQV